MNFNDEQQIMRAVRQRDDAALAAVVKRLPTFDRDYDEVRNVVESAGGGRFVSMGRIRMGTTTICDHLGTAKVEEAT